MTNFRDSIRIPDNCSMYSTTVKIRAYSLTDAAVVLSLYNVGLVSIDNKIQFSIQQQFYYTVVLEYMFISIN